MSGELGRVDIVCDAPPYSVVKACVSLGFRTPLDVRWVRIERREIERKAHSILPWIRQSIPGCSCSHPLPALESYTFTFASGKQSRYYLGQCPRCNTIYWDGD
jgi:hypothetical protein